MRYIPPHERDNRYPIWHVLYLCRIPNIQTMSPDYIRHFGMPSSGDAAIDRQVTNELKSTMLTIAQMVQYHMQGVQIALVQYSDAKVIYEAISDYLVAWKRELETALTTRHAPLEDLIEMDKFANAVYEHAKWQFNGEYVESLLARRMTTALRINRNNILVQEPQIFTTENPDDYKDEGPKLPERNSMAELFGSHLYSNSPTKWK